MNGLIDNALEGLKEASGEFLSLAAFFFLVLVVAVLRRRAVWFVAAMLRLLLEFFAAPLRFLSELLGRAAAFGEGTERVAPRDRGSLLRIVVVAARVAVGTVLLWVAALGITGGLKAGLPSEYAQRAVEHAKDRVADADQALKKARNEEEAFVRLNPPSPGPSPLVVKAEKARDVAKDAYTAAEKAYQLAQDAARQQETATGTRFVDGVEEFLSKRARLESATELEEAKQVIQRFCDSEALPPTACEKALALAPLQREREAKALGFRDAQNAVSEAEDEASSLDRRRSAVTEEVKDATQRLARAEAAVEEAESEASLQFGKAFFALVGAFCFFIGLTWGMGLTLELALLTIRWMDDIAAMRELMERAPGSAPPAAGDGAGGTPPVPPAVEKVPPAA
ncbi:MAG: hypothetical protein RL653_1854 [Pseudomonadota bacterium]|jgi:hypothetical protein